MRNQEDSDPQRMVLHVSKHLVGQEVKEAWSFTLFKVSAVGSLVHLVRSGLLSSVVVTQLKLPALKCSKIEGSRHICVALDGIGADG